MEKILTKVDWRKVAKLAGCVFAGVMAFAQAVGEQKQAAHLVDLETRLKNLESK